MNVKRPGLLFTLVGPAGAGKNQLMKHVLEHANVRQIPTATTRPRRQNEAEGREHFFVEPEVFERMIGNGELLEWQKVHGRCYGMIRAVVEAALDSGQTGIADVDALGAIHVAEEYPENTIGVFIQPPDFETLIKRMRSRGDEVHEISKRLLRVPMELELSAKFDYLIVNDDLAQASDALLQLVTAEVAGRARRPAQVQARMPYEFHYDARVVPVYREELACIEHDSTGVSFLTARIGRGDQPCEAALRAVKEGLGTEPALDSLVHDKVTDEGYVPPLSLDYALNNGVEHIIYSFLYRLDERSALPQGWVWRPLQAFDTLPSALLNAVQRA